MKTVLPPELNQDLMVTAIGICPLLVAATTFITGLSMGILCFLTLTVTTITISGLRNLVDRELRVIIILLTSATVVTILHLAMQLWFYELSLLLGFYIPLLAINCLILADAEGFALRHRTGQSCLRSLGTGSSLLLLLAAVGMFRELAGSGTLLQQSGLLTGETTHSWFVPLANAGSAFAVLKSAPGAFLVLGLVLALNQFITARAQRQVSR